MLDSLKNRWLTMGDMEQRHTSALVLMCAGFLLHYVVFAGFFIEDSAITFSFARNFVEGEGFVTYAGGEPVEGFSNPLWTFILAAFYAVGLDPFIAAKLLGGLFGAITLPFVYGIARRCRPGAEDNVALLPPLFLACSTTYVIWSGAGLENSLFNVLLAAGLYRVLLESEEAERQPISALLFCGLAMTRPEGILYAALAGGFRLLLAIRERRVVKPILYWLIAFWVPFAAYQAWRLNYFGWAWPNTYYAKLDGEDRFKPWEFGRRGWAYTANYMRAYFLAYILPLYAIALVGLRDRRRWMVVALTALGAFLLLWDGELAGEWPPGWWTTVERYWDMGRVLFLLMAVGLLAIGTLWHPGALPRLMVLAIGVAATFFAVYSGGDWMKQWRWFSMVAVPNFIILGLGVGALMDALPSQRLVRVPKLYRRSPRVRMEAVQLKGLAGLLVAGVILAPNVWNSTFSAPEPETSVKDVRRRVEYMARVQRRIHLDRVTLLDVDMGAHMWFSTTDELRNFGVVAPSWQIVDMAGLVDVPMSRHLYQADFMEQYVFEERNPTFAHVHGGWARKTRIPRLDLWEEDYFEITGYPTGRTAYHVGNHLRKDLIVRDRYEGPEGRSVTYDGGVTMEGFELVAPKVSEEGRLYIEVWHRARMRRASFRILVILDDGAGHTHLAELPAGYDWYRPDEWGRGDHVIGRYDFLLPESLPAGRYDLGFALLDEETGEVILPVGHTPAENARVIDGAVFFEGEVEIVTTEEAHAEAEADFEAAKRAAGDLRCEEAWELWRSARYHVWRDMPWRGVRRPELDAAIGACYLGRAEEASGEAERIAALAESRLWDRHSAPFKAVAEPLAQTLTERGDELMEEEQWREAYVAYRDALSLDPTLVGSRRSAEEARDNSLGIIGKERDADRRKREREEAREERRRQREEGGDDEASGGGDGPETPMQRVQRRLRERREGEDRGDEQPGLRLGAPGLNGLPMRPPPTPQMEAPDLEEGEEREE